MVLRAALARPSAAGCYTSVMSPEDSASLPDPDVLATGIVQDLQAALVQFAAIAEELGVEQDLDK